MALTTALMYLICYLCGSIPSGLLLGKLMRGEDIRRIGSGNIGATNAFRLGGKKLAALTFLFDTLKALLPIFTIKLYNQDQAVIHISALLTVIGHIFPIWLKFKGGKGVATSFGAILALHPIIALLMFITWTISFAKYRRSSLSSILSILVCNFLAFLLTSLSRLSFVELQFFLMLSFIVILSHRENLKRLYFGKEEKL